MKLVILGRGRFQADELEGLQTPPAWRKATRNMIMATISMERALAAQPGFVERHREDMGLVLGSSSGELDTSAEFLTTLSRAKMARPLLFQNSLHNATTGFASIHFRLTGPSFSVSAGERTPSECLQLCRSLIASRQARAVLVTLVEVHRVLSRLIGVETGEGAASLLVCDEEFALANAYIPRAPVPEELFSSAYKCDASTKPLYNLCESAFYRVAQG